MSFVRQNSEKTDYSKRFVIIEDDAESVETTAMTVLNDPIDIIGFEEFKAAKKEIVTHQYLDTLQDSHDVSLLDSPDGMSASARKSIGLFSKAQGPKANDCSSRHSKSSLMGWESGFRSYEP
jgi:hypothetical protein